VAFSLAFTGKKSRRAFTVRPYETNADHLVSRYSNSGAVCSGSNSTSGLVDDCPACWHGHRRSRGLASSRLPNSVRKTAVLRSLMPRGRPQLGQPCSGGQERCYLPGNYLALQLQQERLGLTKTQTEVFQPLMLLVQHDDVIDAHLIVIGYHHQLQLEAQGHSGSSGANRSAHRTVRQSPTGSPPPPLCHALLAQAAGLPERVWLRNGVAHSADVQLLDCPPAIDDVNVRAISEADVLVVPAIPERLVLDVLVDMLAMVDQVKRLNPTLRVALVPNLVRQQWPAHAAFIESMATLADEHGLTLLEPVPSRQAIMLGDWRGRPLRHVADWILRGR
jgi:hypothetical protein